jgi:hypothetical protein
LPRFKKHPAKGEDLLRANGIASEFSEASYPRFRRKSLELGRDA